MAKFLDDNGLLYLWGKIKELIPAASTSTPNMDGTGAAGSSASYARADHVHPTDTSRQAALTFDDAPTNGSNNPVKSDGIYDALALKAPLASPALTGTPTAPTATAGTNTTQVATTAFVGAAIAAALSGITGISFEIVASLPATGAAGTIYLVSHGGTGTNVYDEYIYVNNAWEKIGTTDVDLTGYWNSTNLVAITNAEIDTIVAS